MANPEDLGRYRLKRLLGRGAMGQVWEAHDLEHEGNKVAVKILHAADDELALARSTFAREARLASLLRHPHVAAVHDAGEAAGTSFMVMEMVEGRSLRSMIGDPSTTLADKLRWIRQIAEGLTAMHRVGLVHRDLKPENVIVRPDRTACIVDLGMAKWTKFDLGGERDPEDELEAELALPSPPSVYVPPETITMELYDELGDQYAFGVIAYELITGSAPKDDAPPLTERDDVPKAVAAAIDRARSAERGDRWDAMELLLDELPNETTSAAPATAEAPAGGTTSTRPQASASPAERPRLSPVVVGAVVLVIAAVAAFVALR